MEKSIQLIIRMNTRLARYLQNRDCADAQTLPRTWISLLKKSGDYTMKKACITAVFLTGLTGLVHAEETAAIPFEEMDADKNGALSIEEAGNLPEISAQWITLDTNGDGQLSIEEYDVYQAPAPAAGTE
jgi:hypothetical protein